MRASRCASAHSPGGIPSCASTGSGESRRVHIAGVVRQPYGAWIQQVARNKRYLLHDRDPLFTDALRFVMAPSSVIAAYRYSSRAIPPTA